MAKSILVVDDDRGVQHLIQMALEGEGYTVQVADDGNVALQTLAEQTQAAAPPDLILLDYMMPVMDGATFVHESEQRGLRDSIPILLLTAAGQVQQLAAELRAEGYLSKPFDIDVLIDTVAQFFP